MKSKLAQEREVKDEELGRRHEAKRTSRKKKGLRHLIFKYITCFTMFSIMKKFHWRVSNDHPNN